MFPKVSVISVTYRNLDELLETHASVLRQKYSGKIQHIIVDGACDTSISKLIYSPQGNVETLIISEEDFGIYDAMNKGLRSADGDVVWWLNSGDVFSDENAVSNALSRMNHPRKQWGYGITEFVDGTDTFTGTSFPYPYKRDKHYLGYMFVPHPSTFFGIDIVRELQEYDLDIPVAADQVFILRAAEISEPIICPRVLATFRTGGTSSSLSEKEAIRLIRGGAVKHGLRRPKVGQLIYLGVIHGLKSWALKIQSFGD